MQLVGQQSCTTCTTPPDSGPLPSHTSAHRNMCDCRRLRNSVGCHASTWWIRVSRAVSCAFVLGVWLGLRGDVTSLWKKVHRSGKKRFHNEFVPSQSQLPMRCPCHTHCMQAAPTSRGKPTSSRTGITLGGSSTTRPACRLPAFPRWAGARTLKRDVAATERRMVWG